MEGRSKVMAANVDTMVTVTSLADPPPRLVTLDQLLAFAQVEEIRSLVVFTKPDLAGEAAARELAALYESLGYQTLVLNPKAGENVEGLACRARAQACTIVRGFRRWKEFDLPGAGR